MVETGIRNTDETIFIGHLYAVPRFAVYIQITGNALPWEEMVTRRGSSGHLPVKELTAALQLLHQIRQKRTDFFLCIRKLNAEHSCTVKHAVQMILQSKDLMVKHHGRFVNSISEVESTIISRNHHIVNRCNLSVIISKVPHLIHILLLIFRFMAALLLLHSPTVQIARS